MLPYILELGSFWIPPPISMLPLRMWFISGLYGLARLYTLGDPGTALYVCMYED